MGGTGTRARLLDMMGERLPASAAQREDSDLARNEIALREELDGLRAELARSPKENQRGAVVARSEELARGSERYAQLLEEIGEASPEPASAVSVAPRPISEVQAALSEGEVVVEYFSGPDDHDSPVAWAIPREETRCERVQLSRADLDEQVRLFRQLLVQPATPYPTALGRRLYDLLLAPFADLIESAHLICIVPHGSLHYLPFHARRQWLQLKSTAFC